jgi:Zn-dependent peptidase ImmA (M78 family)
VALRTEQYYRQVAADAIASIGVTEPPVPIADVIESLCIPIRPVNLPVFFTAATIYEDGLPVMVVNFARPEIERRRALAHMTGHVLLLLASTENAFPRWNVDHHEADLVARELMMPTSMVIDQARTWFNDFRYLSRLFGVTEGVMLERMRELGLVKNQGVVWDY